MKIISVVVLTDISTVQYLQLLVHVAMSTMSTLVKSFVSISMATSSVTTEATDSTTTSVQAAEQ